MSSDQIYDYRQPNMHQCFLIPEIVNLICEQVDDFYYRTCLGTFAALARTCRQFHEPALNRLWYQLSSLLPLIKCMPADLWKVKETPAQWGETLTFERPILPSDWSRFHVYAQRVQEFFGSPHDKALEHEDYQALDMAAQTTILLPNIKKLKWFPTNDKLFPFIRLFLGPKIKELELRVSGSPLIRLSLLATLPARYPSLTHLKLNTFPSSREQKGYVKTVSATLCGSNWSYLRHLSVGVVSPEALVHIATLPRLQNLSLETTSTLSPVGFPLPRDTVPFPSLRHFSIVSHYLSLCTALIKSMTNQKLIAIKVQTPNAPSYSWKNFLTAVEDHCDHSSLEIITIWDNREWPVDESHTEQFIIRTPHLKPLFSFTNLTTVHLNPSVSFDLDDKDMQCLAKAWPRVTVLTLTRGFLSTREPRTTLLSLVYLAEYCLKLHDLTIIIDARTVPSFPPRKLKGICNKALSTLYIVNSPIKHPKQVAAFLSGIFPSLSTIDSYDKENRDNRDEGNPITDLDKMWTEVEDLIGIFAAIRIEEQARWATDTSGDESDTKDSGDQ